MFCLMGSAIFRHWVLALVAFGVVFAVRGVVCLSCLTLGFCVVLRFVVGPDLCCFFGIDCLVLFRFGSLFI